MKYKLKGLNYWLWIIGTILVFIALGLYKFQNNNNWVSLLNVSFSLLSAGFMVLQKERFDTKDIINSVKPIWRILGVNSKVKFFSRGTGDSVLDNVRYYSLIVDKEHNVQSVNLLDNNEQGIIDFYFSENAVVESEKIYNIKKSPMVQNENMATFKRASKNCKQVTIIRATTIYSDDTYFFEGDDLSGGLTVTEKKKKKKTKYHCTPYSGDWGRFVSIPLMSCLRSLVSRLIPLLKNKRIERAKNYLTDIENDSTKPTKPTPLTTTTKTTTTTTTDTPPTPPTTTTTTTDTPPTPPTTDAPYTTDTTTRHPS